jgi:hypothetical protein
MEMPLLTQQVVGKKCKIGAIIIRLYFRDGIKRVIAQMRQLLHAPFLTHLPGQQQLP